MLLLMLAQLKGGLGWPEWKIQEEMEKRKRDGNYCLFVFAMVCKGWRKAQLKVGGRLRTRVKCLLLFSMPAFLFPLRNTPRDQVATKESSPIFQVRLK